MDHPLKEFLDASDDTISAFARRIGVDASTLQRVIDGEEWPEPATARRIVDATDGAVAFSSLYGERGAVADLGARRGDDDALDPARLAAAIHAELITLVGEAACVEWLKEIEMVADAAANTFAALARITTRRHLQDRVAQALRPVIEEILKDCAASGVPAASLDPTAQRIAARYCQPAQRPPR